MTPTVIPARCVTSRDESAKHLEFCTCIPETLGAEAVIPVSGYCTIGFHLTIPTGATVVFQGSYDGEHWTNITLREISSNGYVQYASVDEDYIGSVSALTYFRVKVTAAGSLAGRVRGVLSHDTAVIEGIEHNSPPHAFGYAPERRGFYYTSAQTDTIIWLPRLPICRLAVTDIVFTVSDRATSLSIFDGTNTPENQLFRGEIKPTAAESDYIPIHFTVPAISSNPGQALRITCTDSPVIAGVVHGYTIHP